MRDTLLKAFTGEKLSCRIAVVFSGLLAAAALLFCLAPAPARAFHALAGEFQATKDCQATVRLRDGDPRDVSKGEKYRLFGLNKQNGSHASIELPSGSGTRRWIDLNCGKLLTGDTREKGRTPDAASVSKPAMETPSPAAPAKSAASPLGPGFFDAVAGPFPDPTPEPPVLDDIDRGILDLCGAWGSKVKRSAFRSFLQQQPQLLQDLTRAISGQASRTARADRSALDILTDLWFRKDGFTHIFCGEPDSDGLGGLHFAPRYRQAWQSGWASRLTAAECRATEIDPPVYTVGVRYRYDGNREGSFCPKGYRHDLDGREMLVAVSALWKAETARNRGGACLVSRKDLPADETRKGETSSAILVTRNQAVITFYPIGDRAEARKRDMRMCGK